MSTGTLLAILLKATVLSFSGFGSLPVLHDELVKQRHVLTDDDLNRAVAVARVTPGAMGCYVVAVGYAAGGWSGAVAGWVAMLAPALLALPIMTFLHTRARSGRWRDATDAVVLASAALVLTTAASLIGTAIVDATTVVVAIAALAAMFLTRVPTTWLLAGGAAAGVMSAWLH